MSYENLTRQVENYIKENILNGNFKINSKLQSERYIAEKFNISRIPVRKAIERLCDQNILEKVPYSSPIISGFKSISLFSSEEPFKSSDIEKIYVESLRTRQLIESEAARLAAVNADKNEIEIIKKAYLKSIKDLEKVYSGHKEECSESDLDFHKSIIKSSHSDLFNKYYALIPETIYSNQFFGFKYRTSLKNMIEDHNKIMDAIEKRNPDYSFNAMYSHLEDVIKLFNK